MSRAGGRTMNVGALARVEGEGGMVVKVRKGTVTQVQLRIYEPPRFFEGLLRGRSYTEPPDITARICGICPVAYQMTACRAIEDACGIAVGGQLDRLRRLLYCGEWIQSHALHVYLLHAPDFLGYPGAVEMAADHRGAVERGLALKRAGNQIMAAVGGRAVHPVNIRVGGFYRVPSRSELRALRAGVEHALHAAVETVRWVSTFEFPDFEVGGTLVALRHPGEYPILDGRIGSSDGIDAPPDRFPALFAEHQVPYSTALHSQVIGGGSYLCGPLARYNLNAPRLSPPAREAAAEAGLGPVCRNLFRSIVVRGVEMVEACAEALRLIEAYEEPDAPAIAAEPRPATGHACTEAPRGLLYHCYEIQESGLIRRAQIVPPTSQNQGQIEQDLRRFVAGHLDLPHADLTHRCEQLIRSYDPCISCATHFLDLRVVAEP